jgi:thiamine-monophosphate kinase
MARIASEDDFLALMDAHFPRHGETVLVGRGDDAAVMACPARLCVTSDLFVEDVHFRRSYFTPAEVGAKGLAVNLSDIAAMGAVPTGFTLGLVCPDDADRDYWDGLLAGMAALAKIHDVPLLGGDLSRGDKIALSVTMWGASGPSGRFLTRGTGNPGDILVAAGDLGLARVGLAVLEKHGRAAMADWPAATAAHLAPSPRLAEGLALAAMAGASSCMDVSDGLARDLPRLLPAGCGADLFFPPASLHPEVTAHAAGHGRPPEKVAFFGGEDYALLATVAPAALPALRAALPGVRPIGAVTAKSGLSLNGAPINERGFDHFG